MRLLPVLLCTTVLAAQPYDLLFHGGHVLDPANGLDAILDVAVSAGRIAAVRPDIPIADARTVVNLTGLYVVPGLVDLHAHVFGNVGSLNPDDTSLPTGATTIVDAGGSGWRTFEAFHSGVMAHARTRVLAWINIVGAGMVGEPAESNTADMDSAKAAEMIQRHRDSIVGLKTAHFMGQGWTAIDHAVAAGRIAGVPIMVDDRIFTNSGRTTREELLVHLRPGDIHTHAYNDRQIELTDRFTGKVQPYMFEARQRGVQFDLGHGAGSFLWPVAEKAMAQGFPPDTISTDLHATSILAGQPDMPNCMSKMMLLGMSLQDVVARSTAAPAKAIHRYPELGTLAVGRGADIAVLQLESGVFAFKDAWGAKRLGTRRLRNVMTVRAGEIVYDRDARALPVWRSVSQDRPAHPPAAIFDVLLKNGHVIDPANHRESRLDVAIANGRIAAVANDLPAAHARIAIEAGRYYVTPGLTLHTASNANYNAFPYGATDVVEGQARVNFAEPAPASLPTLDAASAFLNLGLPLDQIVGRLTAGRAVLTEGAQADVALFELEQGEFAFVDSDRHKLVGNRRLRCVMTIRKGAIVWDSDGLSAPDWIKAGPYSNFK